LIEVQGRYYMRGSTLWSSVLFLALAAGCGTSDEVVPAALDAESIAFDGVLILWNSSGTNDVAEVYSPEAKIVETERVTARGMEEIRLAAATSRDAGHRAERLGTPTVVFKTETGDRYAVAAVASEATAGADRALEMVVLKWEAGSVVAHWWLPVPAAEGDFRVEDNPEAAESAGQMMAAWNSDNNAAALGIYASEVRVYWWGAAEPTGLEDLISNVEAARSISNHYEDIAPPIVLTDESNRVFTVNVSNVSGPGHVNGSLLVAVSELDDGKIVAWTPYFVEDLPPG
jgi:hypothetical protein